MTFQPGTLCEVRPAFSQESGRCDHHDEYAGVEAEVLEASRPGLDALVWVKSIGEVWISRSRLRRIGGGR